MESNPESSSSKRALPQVYRFKITMDEVSPPIWRRIEVLSSIGFYALHSNIQDAMGWNDVYAYRFKQFSRRPDQKSIRLPVNGSKPSYEHDSLVEHYFTSAGDSAVYQYRWPCQIVLEQITPPFEGKLYNYPICAEGERRSPHEAISLQEFQEYLNGVADPNSPSYDRCMNALKSFGYSNHFNPLTVLFKDPDERFKKSVLHR